MSRYLLLAAVGVITLAAGALDGYWSGRWRLEPARSNPLEQFPLTLGDWQGTTQKLEAKSVELAGFDDYILRRYENQRTGAVINVLLARGRSGPLTVHTPEICYGGAGYALTGEETHWSSSDEKGTDEFWRATFARNDSAASQKLRVLWGWYKKGAWVAVDNPRWSLAGPSSLYKLYVTQGFFPRAEATDAQDCLEFVREFVPEFAKQFGQNSDKDQAVVKGAAMS